MTEQEKQKLNEKLARWRFPEITDGMKVREGVIPFFLICDGEVVDTGFVDSPSACFRWLVPKVDWVEITADTVHKDMDDYVIVEVAYDGEIFNAKSKEPALALCLAIEKLIDNENGNNSNNRKGNTI